jgi:HSP20 family protein
VRPSGKQSERKKPMSTLTKPAEKSVTEGVARKTAWFLPLANIFENKDGYVLEAEMPGVNKDGLEITVENNELIITGHRSDAPMKAEAVYRESRELDYRRVFDLDPAIDTAKITAKVDNGVLRLTLPKAESVKPRKISVTD